MILKYENVDIHQGEHLVLHNVNLNVDEKDMIYLTGAVGSGKSSLLKTFYGELPCKGDTAEVLGFDMMKLKPAKHYLLRRQMGIVFQDFQLMLGRTVSANLDFVLRATDWGRKDERLRRIGEVLAMVGLLNKRDEPVYALSGGEQQRVCIARAVLNNPKLILADEPTGNLDGENGRMVLALLDDIRRQQGTAVIMSTHNPLWPDIFPGRVYVCGDGVLRETEQTYK